MTSNNTLIKGNEELWEREKAIYSLVWHLTPLEQAKLSVHKLLRSSLSFFSSLVYQDVGDHLRDKIEIGNTVYEVFYLETSAEELLEAQELKGLVEYEDIPLLLSLRAIGSKDFAICIVRKKGKIISWEKYSNIPELRANSLSTYT